MGMKSAADYQTGRSQHFRNFQNTAASHQNRALLGKNQGRGDMERLGKMGIYPVFHARK
jgi:hypothetical protein